MGRAHYSSGFKAATFFIQMVFLMAVIVMFSLLVNLFGRSMFAISDVGTDSFFDSAYYTQVLSEELTQLREYLQMQNGQQEEQDTTKYRQYKIQFDSEYSNLYYWYMSGNETYTNMKVKEVYNTSSALNYAKTLGSYFHYDDATITFEGNVYWHNSYFERNVLRLFQNSRQGGNLIIAVDTTLEKEDRIKEAEKIYTSCFPWVEVSLYLVMLSAIGYVLCVIYLTLATGQEPEDEKIRLYRIDYLPMEIHLLVFVIYMSALFTFCSRLMDRRMDIASSLVLTGTLVFISDGVLLTIYLSLVRKVKADILLSTSFTSWLLQVLKKSIDLHRVKRWAVCTYVIAVLCGLGLSAAAFGAGYWWGYVGLFVEILIVAAISLQQANQRQEIVKGIIKISDGNIDYKFDVAKYGGECRILAEKINTIGDGLSKAVEDNLKSERLKTELITNVSHDIKTPLTSIINYVNLIKMERIQNEKVENYLEILEKKSMRLKNLSEDLVEVSKISSGNIELDMQPIDMVELIYQTGGEFNEFFEDKGLTIITRLPKEPVMIRADGNRIWRVIQNLYNNAAKYALKDTRVYVELKVNNGKAEFSIKDISAQELKDMPEDLGERFVRGDDARATEGSGLGLSIARSLTNLMGGSFEISLDGDLFTAAIIFPCINS